MQSFVDGYSIGSAIGIGGFSTVYRARQDQFDRDVALKILNIRLDDPRAVERFNNECLALGRLDAHPNIADVYAAGIGEHGKPYIAMRWYRAGSVADLLAAKGELPIDQVLTVGRQIADALAAAHDLGIIHRDVKPQNILVSERGEFALSDFGVSALEHQSVGAVANAFSYTHAAPETLESGDFSTASDQFALASTLYTLVTGSAPFPARSAADEPRPANPATPEFDDQRLGQLAPVLRKAMASAPNERYGSMREFASALGAERSTEIVRPTTWPGNFEATVIKAAAIKEQTPHTRRGLKVTSPTLTTPRIAALSVVVTTVIVALARWLMSLTSFASPSVNMEWISFQSVLYTLAGIAAAALILTKGPARSLGYGAALFILASRFKVVTASLLTAAMEDRVLAITMWAALLVLVGGAVALVASSALRNGYGLGLRPHTSVAFWIMIGTAVVSAGYTFWAWAGTVEGVTDFALLCVFITLATAVSIAAITAASRFDPDYGLLGYAGAFIALHGVFVLGVALDLTAEHHLWYELALLAALVTAVTFAFVARNRDIDIDLRLDRTTKTELDGQPRQVNSASQA